MAKAKKTVLLRYPEVLPARTWVRNNLLWADELSAFWPTEQPRTTSSEQEQVLGDLRLLQQEGVFRPRQVDIRPGHMTQLLNRMAPEAVTGEDTEWSRDHAAFLGGPDSGATHVEDERAFAYASKFNGASLSVLRERGAFTPVDASEKRFRAAPAVLDLLLQAAAEKEARGKRQLVLPVPSRPALARGLLEPRTDQAADIAAVLQVPLVPKVHASHSIEALLQLRATAALERGRRDYLDGMAAVIDELQQLHNPQADVMLDPYVHVLAAGRIAEDVAAARRSYVQQLDKRDIVVAMSTLVANLLVTIGSSQTADPSEVVAAAVANVAADSVGVVGALFRRRSAPTFLSEVGRLVAPA